MKRLNRANRQLMHDNGVILKPSFIRSNIIHATGTEPFPFVHPFTSHHIHSCFHPFAQNYPPAILAEPSRIYVNVAVASE